MKTYRLPHVGVALAALLIVALCPAAHAGHRLGVGARYHTDHSVFKELPYDNDISYGLVYQYVEDVAYWELAATYTPSPSLDSLDYIITPQANLVLRDGIWRGGLGILSTYTEDKVTGDDWTDIYWQMMLGVSIPLGRLQLDVHAYYVYEGWDDLPDFEFGDVETGAWLVYPF